MTTVDLETLGLLLVLRKIYRDNLDFGLLLLLLNMINCLVLQSVKLLNTSIKVQCTKFFVCFFLRYMRCY